jgi:hypothetical protein
MAMDAANFDSEQPSAFDMFWGPPITLGVADISTDESAVDGSTVEAANFEIDPSWFTESEVGGFVGAEAPLLMGAITPYVPNFEIEFVQNSIPANTYRTIGPPAIKGLFDFLLTMSWNHVPSYLILTFQDPRDVIQRFENVIHDRETGKTYTNTELIQVLRNTQSALVQGLGTQAQVLCGYLLDNLSLEITCKFKRGLVSEEWNTALGAHPIVVWWNSDAYSWSSLAIIDYNRPSIAMRLCYDKHSITVSVKFTESGDWTGLDSRGKPGVIRLQGT